MPNCATCGRVSTPADAVVALGIEKAMLYLAKLVMLMSQPGSKTKNPMDPPLYGSVRPRLAK